MERLASCGAGLNAAGRVKPLRNRSARQVEPTSFRNRCNPRGAIPKQANPTLPAARWHAPGSLASSEASPADKGRECCISLFRLAARGAGTLQLTMRTVNLTTASPANPASQSLNRRLTVSYEPYFVDATHITESTKPC